MENITYQEKKLDAEELLEALGKLSEETKLKIYYMMKGIELVSEKKQEDTA